MAGYGGDDNVLGVTAYNNLRKPKIREAIEARLETEAMAANEVLWRLAEQARGSVADFIEITEDGWTINLEKAKEAGKLHLIKKLKVSGDVPEIELHDQQAALTLLGKHFGLFKETVDHNVTVFNIDEWRERRKERLAQVEAMPGEAGGAATD